jgi:hypothetical protein
MKQIKKREIVEMTNNNAAQTDNTWMQDLLEMKHLEGQALLKLNANSVYVINDNDLDTGAILLLFYSGGEC